jgi:GNAT superfamily N-acetyltransferase
MSDSAIDYSERRDLPIEQALELYRANGWSSANKPTELQGAFLGSHSLVTAWSGAKLVGLGNALSDGHLVVYYPHLLVHPNFQRRGVGGEIMRRLMLKYAGFHTHMLVADRNSLDFYSSCGFERAGHTVPMWIYAGDEH